MIKAAQVGLGWWGKTLVESVQGTSDKIQFVSATSRTKSDDYLAFAKDQGLTYADSYEAILADPNVDVVFICSPEHLRRRHPGDTALTTRGAGNRRREGR